MLKLRAQREQELKLLGSSEGEPGLQNPRKLGLNRRLTLGLQ